MLLQCIQYWLAFEGNYMAPKYMGTRRGVGIIIHHKTIQKGVWGIMRCESGTRNGKSNSWRSQTHAKSETDLRMKSFER